MHAESEQQPFECFFLLLLFYFFICLLWPALQMSWPCSSIPFFLFCLFPSNCYFFSCSSSLSLNTHRYISFSLSFYLNSSGYSFMVIIFSTLYTHSTTSSLYFIIYSFPSACMQREGCILASLYFITIYFFRSVCMQGPGAFLLLLFINFLFPFISNAPLNISSVLTRSKKINNSRNSGTN